MDLVKSYLQLGRTMDMATKAEISRIGKEIEKVLPEDLSQVAFVCVGTMAVVGDSLGPRVGMYLARRGFSNIYGTPENPCHAQTVRDIMKLVDQPFVFVINAASAKFEETIGRISVRKGSMKLGAGIGRSDLPEIGDASMSIATFYAKPDMRLSWVLHSVDPVLIDQLSVTVGRSIQAAYRIRKYERGESHVLRHDVQVAGPHGGLQDIGL